MAAKVAVEEVAKGTAMVKAMAMAMGMETAAGILPVQDKETEMGMETAAGKAMATATGMAVVVAKVMEIHTTIRKYKSPDTARQMAISGSSM
jgi:signal transduction protein with GAF and PtsI domain